MLITEDFSYSVGKGSAQYHLQNRKKLKIYISFFSQRTSANLYNLYLKHMEQSFKRVSFNETIYYITYILHILHITYITYITCILHILYYYILHFNMEASNINFNSHCTNLYLVASFYF